MNTGLCTFECLYFALEPVGSYAVADRQDWLGVAVLLLTGVMSSLLFDSLQKARLSDALAQSQTDDLRRQFAAIVEPSDEAIIGKDRDGVITSWNPSAEKMFGYSAKEATGQPITFLMTPEIAKEELAIQAKIWNGESVDHYETRRKRKNGADVFVSVSVSPIRDASGRIIGASKIARDITEHKRAEEALRRTVEFDEAALKGIGEGLCTIDADGLVTSMNPAAEELLGWTFSELRGKKLHEVTHHHRPDGRSFPHKR